MPRVQIDRIAWLVTVLACLVLAVLLVLGGYQGYAAVSAAVGIAAAINLGATKAKPGPKPGPPKA